MVHQQLILVVLLVFVGSIVEGSSIYGISTYGKCWKYGPTEMIPNLRGGYWYCLPGSNGFQYCILVECPRTNCKKPLSLNSGGCRFCLGTCSYGGKVFNVGDSFTCLDGINICRCLDNNGIASTSMATNYQAMCQKILT